MVVAAIVEAGLFFGRDVLMPFALAGLLSFLVAPIVGHLERWRVPRVPAVFIVVVLSFARMLASDPDEAEDVVRTFLKTGSTAELYDQLLIPALSLAEEDRYRGALDDVQKRFVLENTKALIDNLPDLVTTAVAHADARLFGTIAIVPAHDASDELAGVMLAQLLAGAGVSASVLPSTALVDEQLQAIHVLNPHTVCVSAVPPAALAHAADACKRLRAIPRRSSHGRTVEPYRRSHSPQTTRPGRSGQRRCDVAE